MNAKELKEALKGVPDDLPVFIYEQTKDLGTWLKPTEGAGIRTVPQFIQHNVHEEPEINPDDQVFAIEMVDDHYPNI